METSALLQTIAVLAACVVFLAKQGLDTYKRYGQKKNGDSLMGVRCRAHDNTSLLEDLHKWHRPITDPATGQPRFLWYVDSQELRAELEKNRDAMDELRGAMAAMGASIAQLVEEIRSGALRCKGDD